MKLLLEKPTASIEAAEKKKGMFILWELLVFCLVYGAVHVAVLVIQLPMFFVLLIQDDSYQAAIAVDDIEAALAAEAALASGQTYSLFSIFSFIGMILVTTLFCKLIQKRPMRTLGFRKQGMVKEYLVGMLIGFVMFSVVVLLAMVSGVLKMEGISPDFSIGMFLLFLVAFMIQGMAEEVLLRGYFMISISRRYSMIVAILVNSIGFAAMHFANQGITLMGFINIALFGIFESVYFVRRGNIWGMGASHAIWNFVQGNFYGINVSGWSKMPSLLACTHVEGKDFLSGGSFGLEGSIFSTVVLVIVIIVVYRWGNVRKENEN